MRKRSYGIIVVIVICLGLSLGLAACATPPMQQEAMRMAPVNFAQTSTTRVNGYVSRQQPTVKDGGLSDYPGYNHTITDATLKEQIAKENSEMFQYDKIDSQGNLYIEEKIDNKSTGVYNKIDKKLYKHTAADSIYQESISPDAQAVSAKIHLNPSNIGNNLTGLYIPAGEMVTIIIDDRLIAMGGLTVEIGYGSQRGGSINIPAGRDYTRFPITRKQLVLKDNINYIGSPLGGALYIHSEMLVRQQNDIQYDVTVIGAVQSPQYYVGATTDEEWLKSREYPGLFFHLETRAGVRLTMPSEVARQKTAQEMRQIGEFWQNTATISNKLANGGWYSNHPVDMLFDSHVPAGAAVAIVGADVAICPTGWAQNALNYYGMTNNGGWGVLHEFNHHHQGWGAGAGGEVTNNVAILMTYMLNTNVAAYRQDSSMLGGGNWGTDAYQSLTRTRQEYDRGNVNREASLYADLIHAFGEEFIYKLAAKTPVQKVTGTNQEDDLANFNQFYYQASMLSGMDMTYYLETVNGFTLSENKKADIAALKLPMFVPIASPYQTGISINSGDYITMGKPYYLAMGKTKEIDFGKFVDMPNIEVQDVKITFGTTLGKLEQIEGNRYSYTPSAESGASDEIILEVTRKIVGGASLPNAKIKIILVADGTTLNGNIWQNSGYASIDDAIIGGLEQLSEQAAFVSGSASFSTNVANTIGKVSGKIVLPKGEYTFVLKGDDMAKAVVTDSVGEKVARLEHNSGYNLSNLDTVMNIVSDGTAMAFDLYMLNGGGGGNAGLGYVEPLTANTDKPKVVDIPSKYVFNVGYSGGNTKQDVIQRYSSEQYRAVANIVDMGQDAKVTVAPKNYGNDVANNAVDGNKSTFYHSHTGVEFPSEMVIDYGKSIEFNAITILPRVGNGYGRIKDYELYGGDTPNSMFEIAKGVGQNSSQGFVIDTGIVSARYIKIVVKSVFEGNYFAIGEIMPSMRLASTNVLMSNSELYNYRGEWARDSFGSSLNGEVQYTTGGSVTIRFKGKSFAIMGNTDYDYGKAALYIDGKKHATIDYSSMRAGYNQSLIVVDGLKDKQHNIELKAEDGQINFNYFVFNPTSGSVEYGGQFVYDDAVMYGGLTKSNMTMIYIGIGLGILILLVIAVVIGQHAYSQNKAMAPQYHDTDNANDSFAKTTSAKAPKDKAKKEKRVKAQKDSNNTHRMKEWDIAKLFGLKSNIEEDGIDNNSGDVMPPTPMKPTLRMGQSDALATVDNSGIDMTQKSGDNGAIKPSAPTVKAANAKEKSTSSAKKPSKATTNAKEKSASNVVNSTTSGAATKSNTTTKVTSVKVVDSNITKVNSAANSNTTVKKSTNSAAKTISVTKAKTAVAKGDGAKDNITPKVASNTTKTSGTATKSNTTAKKASTTTKGKANGANTNKSTAVAKGSNAITTKASTTVTKSNATTKKASTTVATKATATAKPKASTAATKAKTTSSTIAKPKSTTAKSTTATKGTKNS